MRDAIVQNWLDVADVVSRRSHCIRSQTGAVIIGRHSRVVSTGYNGPPAGYGNIGPCSGWCPRGADRDAGDKSIDYGNCPAIHAEANALLFASRDEVEGGTIYITRVPCWDCAKLISNSGLESVVYYIGDIADAVRPVDLALDLLTKSGLIICGYDR